MIDKKTVSIIIPTYKRREDLMRLLISVAASDYPKKKLEIVIVDNAGDLSVNYVKHSIGQIKLTLVHPAQNLFCSGGRLYGAKMASGKYLFFVDDDNILAPDCIKLLLNSFDNNPSLGVVMPLMLVFKDKERIWAAGVKLNKLWQPVQLYCNKYLSKIALPEIIPDIDCFPNAFMVRRKVLEEVPFDVLNFPHNWSEADFGLRVKKRGYNSAVITNAREWHNIDYSGPLTRTDSVKIYDQAKARILFRKRFSASLADWFVFIFVLFPISSFYYMRAIITSPDKDKFKMLKRYIRGTFDGMTTHITKEV